VTHHPRGRPLPPPAAPSWGAWFAALADLLLPVTCPGCDAPSTPWCDRCRGAFARPRVLSLPGLAPVLALAPYAGAARAAVLAYKERGRRDLAAPLAGALRAGLAGAGMPAVAVVPAPSRPRAARCRGGDHVLRLARELLRETSPAPPGCGGGPVVARALALGAGARDSVGLDPAARSANLARHLRLRPRALEGVDAALPTVLLDDVLTTGATARAATALLCAAGRAPVAVVVLTAVPAAPARLVGTDPVGRRRRRGRHPDGRVDAS
jgi:predicted amidophosphoribosyltransferase